jgi:hypothetical protein
MSDDALDIIDQLLANEGKSEKKKAAPKKKRRGRPKGSKNKPKPTASKTTEKKTDKKTKKPKKEKVEVKYVTEDEWEELGRPPIYEGYSTNRTVQWKYKTKAYREVELEFHRAAIQYSKLAKTIGWYSETDEHKLELCKKEIVAWRKRIGISHHEMGNVIDIAYNCFHKRKKMVKQLRAKAIDILQTRKDDLKAQLAADPENEELLIEQKSLTLNSVAQVPANIRPVLEFVKLAQTTGEDDVLGALADLTGNPLLLSEHACTDHPTYRGLRKARNGCPNCLEYWKYNKAKGVKEKRVRG